jgi:hypothetical protein
LQTDVIDPQLLEHDAQLPNEAIINTIEQLELDLIKLACPNNDLPYPNTQTREVS